MTVAGDVPLPGTLFYIRELWRAVAMKASRIILLVLAVVVFLFLFTRPSDYRGLAGDVAGTLEDQWCAWTEIVGNECDRWRHARRIIDGARELGDELESRIPTMAPVEDASPRQD